MANPDPLTLPSRDAGRVGLTTVAQVPVGKVALEAELLLPDRARGLVLLAHGSGSPSDRPRARDMARALRRWGLGTLLFDALTPSERRQDALDERLRFDVRLLARRLAGVTDWVRSQAFGALPLGYHGAGLGAAVAIVAAAERPASVRAVVCQGGRPDLAGSALHALRAPTLLLVGSHDTTLLASSSITSKVPPVIRLQIVPGAGPLFEEPGMLEAAAERAGAWLLEHSSQVGRP